MRWAASVSRRQRVVEIRIKFFPPESCPPANPRPHGHRHNSNHIVRSIRRKCHVTYLHYAANEIRKRGEGPRRSRELWLREPTIFTVDEVDYLACGWPADVQSVMRHPALLDEGPMLVRNVELGALWALRSFPVHQAPEYLLWS